MLASKKDVSSMVDGSKDEDDRVNGVIRDLVKIAPVRDKMRETRLRWFSHVKRRSADGPVRRCERINIPEGRRGGDEQRRAWTR